MKQIWLSTLQQRGIWDPNHEINIIWVLTQSEKWCQLPEEIKQLIINKRQPLIQCFLCSKTCHVYFYDTVDNRWFCSKRCYLIKKLYSNPPEFAVREF